MGKDKQKLIVIAGTTASGKTALGVDLALRFNGEIVSADSRQVYRGMDIGTGKDLKEYTVKRNGKKTKVPYHLIDVVSPRTRFGLASYQKKAFKAIDDILSRGKIPFLVGGTGLYIQSIVDNYDLSGPTPDKKLRDELEKLNIEEIVEKLKIECKISDKKFQEIVKEKNKRRLARYLEFCVTTKKPLDELFKKNKQKYNTLMLGLTFDKDTLSQRIEKRIIERLEKEDMVGEVERLKSDGISWKRLEGFGLEYRWLSLYLKDIVTYNEMVGGLSSDTRKFAKRQMTWFKRDKRIVWPKEKMGSIKLVKDFLKK